jgi:hypothetical protein
MKRRLQQLAWLSLAARVPAVGSYHVIRPAANINNLVSALKQGNQDIQERMIGHLT